MRSRWPAYKTYQEKCFLANTLNTARGARTDGFRAALTGRCRNTRKTRVHQDLKARCGADVREGLTPSCRRIPPAGRGTDKAVGNRGQGMVQQDRNDRSPIVEEDPHGADDRESASGRRRQGRGRRLARPAGGRDDEGWPPSSPTARNGTTVSARSSCRG